LPRFEELDQPLAAVSGPSDVLVATDLLDADGNRPFVLLVAYLLDATQSPQNVEDRLFDQIKGDPCAVPCTDERPVVSSRNASRRPDSVDASSTVPVRDDFLDRAVRLPFGFDAERGEKSLSNHEATRTWSAWTPRRRVRTGTTRFASRRFHLRPYTGTVRRVLVPV
jgi:hypothetical protein